MIALNLSLLNGYEEYTKKFLFTPKSDPHFIEALKNTPYGEPTFTLWPVAPKILTPILSLLDDYDTWHGFQISFRREEYCEMFSFTFDKQSGDKYSFYVKNILILLQFVNYFRMQGLDLIENNSKNKLAVFPEKFFTKYVSNKNSFREFLYDKHKNIMIKDQVGNVVSLTPRENDCLKIAPRTAELHMQNIKRKLRINYKSQLIDIYNNNFISKLG